MPTTASSAISKEKLAEATLRESEDHYIQRYHATGQERILNTPRELIALRKDGSTFPIDLSVTEVSHSGYFTGIVHDISDRKRLQRHILEISSDEQRRIGCELHDGTGQELTGLSLTARALLEMVNAIPTATIEGHTLRQLGEDTFLPIRETPAKVSQKLVEAVRMVLAGERFLSPATTLRLVNQSLGLRDKTEAPVEINQLQWGLCASSIQMRLPPGL